MADNQFESEFTAQIGQFERSMDTIEKSVDGVRKKLREAGVDVGAFEKDLNKIEKSTVGVRNGLSDVGTGAKAASTGARELSGSQDQAKKSTDALTSGLANQRYALYDVASTYGVVGAAMLASAGYALTVGASYEKAFTGVERVAVGGEAAIGNLRDGLVDLSTEIPSTFQDLSGVATLGAQLDIATNDLTGFTSTVTKFSAVAGTSLDTTAEGFGRIGQLLGVAAEDYDRLGSAILYAGNTSVATEGDVLQYSQRLSQVTAQFNVSAQSVVAWGAVLASTANGLEASQGAFSRLFGGITKDVALGSENLQQFANISGQTAEQFAAAWRNSPEDAFNNLIGALAELDAEQRTVALSAAGINNVRDIRTVNNLANQYELLQAQLGGVNQAWDENARLTEQYDKTVDDLASQWQIFVNGINNFIDAVSGGATKGVAELLGVLTGVLEVATDIASNPIVQWIGGFALAMTALIGALFTYKATMALAVASTYAFRTAQASLDGVAKGGAITELLRTLVNMPSANAAATASTVALTTAQEAQAVAVGRGAAAWGVFKAALSAVGIGAAIIGGLALLNGAIESITQSFESAEGKAERVFGDISGFSEAIAKDTAEFEKSGKAIHTFSTEVERSTSNTDYAKQKTEDWLSVQEEVSSTADEATNAVSDQTYALGENADAWLRKTIAENENFQNFANDPAQIQFFKDLGGSIDEYVLALEQGRGDEYLAQLDASLRTLQETASEGIGTPEGFIDQNSVKVQELQASYNNLIGTLNPVTDAMTALFDTEMRGKTTQDLLGISAEDTTGALEGMEDQTEAVTDKLTDLIDAQFALAGGTASVMNAIDSLSQSLADNGATFDQSTRAGVENTVALGETISAMATAAGDDTASFIANVNGLLQGLKDSGIDTSQIIGMVQEILASVDGSVAGVGLDASQLVNEAARATQALDEVQRARNALNNNGIGGALALAQNIGQEAQYTIALKNIQALQNQGVAAGNAIAQVNTGIADSFADAYGGALDGVANSAGNATDATKELKEEIYTLADYASDLQEVFNDAFDIRFGVQIAKDASRDLWQGIRDDQKAAREQIQGYRQDLRDLKAERDELLADRSGLQSDKKLQQYYLKIARGAKDELAISRAQSNIQGIDADLGTNSNDLKKNRKEQKDAAAALLAARKADSRSLKGNSEAARNNRKSMRDLTKSYQDQVIALAESGVTGEALEKKTKALRKEFNQQATSLGFSRAQLKPYNAALADTSKIIRDFPKAPNLTIRANASPAEKALQRFRERMADARKSAAVTRDSVNKSLSGINKNVSANVKVNVEQPSLRLIIDPADVKLYRKALETGRMSEKEYYKAVYGVDYGRFYNGGFTGRGGRKEAAGIVDRGEYVVPQEGVNQRTGLPKADYMASLIGTAPALYSRGASASSAPSTVSTATLSDTDRRLLAGLGTRPIYLVTNGKVIAQVVDNENQRSNNLGR